MLVSLKRQHKPWQRVRVLASRRAQLSALMVSLVEAFSPAYLQPLPLRALATRACLNLVNKHQSASSSSPCLQAAA